MKTIVLLSCCKQKLTKKAPAAQLYQSAGFKKSLAYAKSIKPDAIYILSAKHHLVGLGDELEPYDECLKDKTNLEKNFWAVEVYQQLSKVADLQNDKFIILCGIDYYESLLPFIKNYELPLKGLSLGFRLRWFDQHTIKENNLCIELHKFFNEQKRYTFPFDSKELPENGIYVLFEKGETFNGMDRIVRVGTHTVSTPTRNFLNLPV